MPRLVEGFSEWGGELSAFRLVGCLHWPPRSVMDFFEYINKLLIFSLVFGACVGVQTALIGVRTRGAIYVEFKFLNNYIEAMQE